MKGRLFSFRLGGLRRAALVAALSALLLVPLAPAGANHVDVHNSILIEARAEKVETSNGPRWRISGEAISGCINCSPVQLLLEYEYVNMEGSVSSAVIGTRTSYATGGSFTFFPDITESAFRFKVIGYQAVLVPGVFNHPMLVTGRYPSCGPPSVGLIVVDRDPHAGCPHESLEG